MTNHRWNRYPKFVYTEVSPPPSVRHVDSYEEFRSYISQLAQPKRPKIAEDTRIPTNKSYSSARPNKGYHVNRINYLSIPATRITAEPGDNYHVPPAALNYEPTVRILELSEPKRYFPAPTVNVFHRHRKRIPKPSKRLLELAKPKPPPPPEQLSKTSSEVTRIRPAALKAEATERIATLADPKTVTEKYTPMRTDSMIWDPFGVSQKALKAYATPRTVELSKPKVITMPTKLVYSTGKKFHYVPKAALRAKLTSRTAALARPKERIVFPEKKHGKVTKAALHATATDRMAELATPKQVTVKWKDQEDPEWTGKYRLIGEEELNQVCQEGRRASQEPPADMAGADFSARMDWARTLFGDNEIRVL